MLNLFNQASWMLNLLYILAFVPLIVSISSFV